MGREIERGIDGVAVRRQHDNALAAADRIAVQQALRSRSEQDAGQVIVTEDDRLLDRAAREHDGAGAQQRESTVDAVHARNRDLVIRIEAESAAGRHDADPRLGGNGRAQCVELRSLLRRDPACPRAAAARHRVFVDEHDTCGAGSRCLEGGCKTCCPRADDGDLAEFVHTQPWRRALRDVDVPQSAQVPDQAFE